MVLAEEWNDATNRAVIDEIIHSTPSRAKEDHSTIKAGGTHIKSSSF